MLILSESFEFTTDQASKWNQTVPTISTSNARTGTRAMNAQQTARRKIDASEEHVTLIAGGAYRAGTGSFGTILIFYGDTSTVHITIYALSDGTIQAFRGSQAGTLLGATAPGVFKYDSVYQYIEVKVTLSDTVGEVTIRRDETVVLNLTGIDTKNAGTGAVLTGVAFLSITTLGRLDDLYLCNGAGAVNNDFLGVVTVEALLPDGNGNSSQMTNSAGNSTNNYTYVDDALPTPDGANYVDGASGGVKDTYSFADSAQPVANSVKAVVVYAYAWKTDAGARGIDTVARSGGSELTETPVNPLQNGVAKLLWGVHETRPGGTDWSVADYNAAEFGIVTT